jgi:heme/copper-type cytochrome/quinol oxidase subunit 2
METLIKALPYIERLGPLVACSGIGFLSIMVGNIVISSFFTSTSVVSDFFIFASNDSDPNKNRLEVIVRNFIKNYIDNSDDPDYYKRHTFTSNMIRTDDLHDGYFRLLTTDRYVTLPYEAWIRVLVTSMDVLHS